jgi:hypothetical protein
MGPAYLMLFKSPSLKSSNNFVNVHSGRERSTQGPRVLVSTAVLDHPMAQKLSIEAQKAPNKSYVTHPNELIAGI